MPTITSKNRFVIDVPNLGGGRNTKDSNTLILDTEAVDIENFDFEERGALKKVPGSAKLNANAIEVQSAAAWITRANPADNNWDSVCWSPELSLFVAVAYSGTGNRVMTSLFAKI